MLFVCMCRDDLVFSVLGASEARYRIHEGIWVVSHPILEEIIDAIDE